MNPSVKDHARSALIAEAMTRPGDDPIFALNGEATKRKQAGESILNATLGALFENDGSLAVMSVANEAMLGVPADRAAAYAPIAGDPPFLDAVIADLFGSGPLASQAIAVATPGATGALQHAVANFVEPGESVLTTDYFWGPYKVIASHGRKGVTTFRMFGEDGRLDVASFESGLMDLVASQGRALILFNFPCHNPTGYSLHSDEWASVAEIVRKAGEKGPVCFLLDYAYGTFGSAETHGWLDHISTMLESATVLLAWTASKAFTQYGSRVGAVVALHESEEERARLKAALSYSSRATWSNCNHRGLLAVTELLTDPALAERVQSERSELVALLDERVAMFNERAAATSITYPRYDGGFFISVFTPDSEVTAARMRELGVYVVPIPGAVRVALCATPLAAVPRMVEALADGVAAAMKE